MSRKDKPKSPIAAPAASDEGSARLIAEGSLRHLKSIGTPLTKAPKAGNRKSSAESGSGDTLDATLRQALPTGTLSSVDHGTGVRHVDVVSSDLRDVVRSEIKTNADRYIVKSIVWHAAILIAFIVATWQVVTSSSESVRADLRDRAQEGRAEIRHVEDRLLERIRQIEQRKPGVRDSTQNQSLDNPGRTSATDGESEDGGFRR